ncbi:MAG: hypothetical protein M1359_01565 [Betaproteobacteria bacterium]|nr:hypothetical protein [Betaproteobacteria bacterium]
MVALVLGLLMIGAVTIVFISNQQTSRTKQEMDRAQEAFRFASHTIMRVVQQGVIRDPATSTAALENGESVLLVVRMNPPPAPPAPVPPAPAPPPEPTPTDCFGRAVGPNLDRADIVFTLYPVTQHRAELRCHVVSVPRPVTPQPVTPDPVVETLVYGLDPRRTAFSFGVRNQSVGFWSDNDRWVSAGDVLTEWPFVRSVRVRMAMQTEEDSEPNEFGPMAVFSATMRCGGWDNC